MKKSKIVVSVISLTSAMAFAATGFLNYQPTAAAANPSDATMGMALPIPNGLGFQGFVQLANTAEIPATFNLRVVQPAGAITGNGTIFPTTSKFPLKYIVPPHGITTLTLDLLLVAASASGPIINAMVFVQSDLAGAGAAVRPVLLYRDRGALTFPSFSHCIYNSTSAADQNFSSYALGLPMGANGGIDVGLMIANPDAKSRKVKMVLYGEDGGKIADIPSVNIGAYNFYALTGADFLQRNDIRLGNNIYVNLQLVSDDSSPLTATVTAAAISSDGPLTISDLSFCPVTNGSLAASPSGS